MDNTSRRIRKTDEPTMSDAMLLLKVEDLIHFAISAGNTNIVDFQMLHSVLQILARQMRILEQDVEIKLSEEDEILAKLREAYGLEVEKPEEEEKEVKVEVLEEVKLPELKSKSALKSTTQLVKSKISVDIPVSGSQQGLETKEDEAEGEEPVTRIGSIEVVTPAKFQKMVELVEELLNRTGGVSLPHLPSNIDLLAELAQGTASLTDTMEAMQVNVRVETAEKVITKMAEILTELALSGALPAEVATTIASIRDDMEQIALGVDPETLKAKETSPELVSKAVLSGSVIELTPSEAGKVTFTELEEVTERLREDLGQNLTYALVKTDTAIENTTGTALEVEEQVDIAKSLLGRIKHLQIMTDVNLEQLNGFGDGMTTQVNAFNILMSDLRNEVTEGIIKLDSINNNAEAIAMKALCVGYENLLVDLEQAANAHGGLMLVQKKLTDDLKFLFTFVELLREEKADRDEVEDGLREKANRTRLRGLVTQGEFEEAREALQYKLTQTTDKFEKQEKMFLSALKQVSDISKLKSDITELLSLRHSAGTNMNSHYHFLQKLEELLGDPEVALLTRKLSKNAYCGPCVTPALMDVFDKRNGAPPRLPALLHHHEPHSPPHTSPARPAEDTGKHVCLRWVGGSHTRLTERATHERATLVTDDTAPTKQYTGYGADGRLYLMEDDLEPCLECSRLPSIKFEDAKDFCDDIKRWYK